MDGYFQASQSVAIVSDAMIAGLSHSQLHHFFGGLGTQSAFSASLC
jgi:hypothetical protein